MALLRKRKCLGFSTIPFLSFLIGIVIFLYVLLAPKEYSVGAVRNYIFSAEPVSETGFKSFDANKTRTYHYVCFTNFKSAKPYYRKKCRPIWVMKKTTIAIHGRACGHEQKRITVYDKNKDTTDTFKKIGYKVDFKDVSQLPKDYKIISNQTAYLLGKNEFPWEPYNFFHFTKQIYFPLYWMIKATNQLYKGAENIVFYPGVYALCDFAKVMYYDINIFKFFYNILFVKNKLELSSFVDIPEPHKVCYKNAVFSTELFLDKAMESIDYFKKSIGIEDGVCKGKTLTLINRSKYRRVLNADELKEAAESLGYRTTVVFMEKLSLKEQAQLIHCTNILVGVAGAGLQWAYFMKNPFGAIEIGWPYKEWHFFFAGSGWYKSDEEEIRPLTFHRVNGTCHLNPTAVNIYVWDVYKRKTEFSRGESMKILKDPRNYNYTANPVGSVGKLCDVTVDVDEFKKVIIKAEKNPPPK